jgi:hypothetical protein
LERLAETQRYFSQGDLALFNAHAALHLIYRGRLEPEKATHHLERLLVHAANFFADSHASSAAAFQQLSKWLSKLGGPKDIEGWMRRIEKSRDARP